MFRLIGFLLGSTASILVLLAVVDGPEFSRTRDITNALFPELAQRVEQAFPALKVEHARETPAMAAPPLTTETAPAERTATAPLIPPGGQAETEPFTDAIDIGRPSSSPVAEPPGEPRWHPIWNPFRSELSARGFAARLEGLTGLEYRVTQISLGSYQVAFAHMDDAERQTNLARIEATTGLRLTEDLP